MFQENYRGYTLTPRHEKTSKSESGTPTRLIALKLFEQVFQGAYATPLLNKHLRDIGVRRDRSFITDLLYGTLRNFIYLEACLTPRLRAPKRLPKIVYSGLIMASYEILIRGTPRHAAVFEWVQTIKRLTPPLAGLVNGVLRSVAVPNNLEQPTKWSLPGWLADSFISALGPDAAEDAALSMLKPGPLWLATTGAKAVPSLLKEGCKVTEGPLPNTVAIRSPLPLYKLLAYREGLVQPQNPSSRYPVHALDVKPGDLVLDLASGNGIKAAHLATLGAQVVSVDKSSSKLSRARDNLLRMGLNADQHIADLSNQPDLKPAAKVLLDAPCSGTGTLRGNPEIKLRLTSKQVSSLAELQALLLDTASELTLPGGTLDYSVCSLTPDEGLGVISNFLAEKTNFCADKSLPPQKLRNLVYREGTYIVPTNGVDGFFVAKLRKGPL